MQLKRITLKGKMKRSLSFSPLIGICLFVVSCGGGESPESCAKRYCELSAKYKNASSAYEKAKAGKERNDYENELEAKHKGDKEFFKNFEKEVEKCGGGG